MINIFIKRPVTTMMLVLVVILGGLLAYTKLELALMPGMNLPVAIVSTTYTGAGPEEIEELITKPIEETVATLTGVDKITSTSSVGSSSVTVHYVDGTDLDNAVIDLNEKINRMKGTLPSAANEPMVLKIDLTAENLSVGITGEQLSIGDFYDTYERKITGNFEKIEGVSSVDIVGGQEQEIQIIVDQNKLNHYGVSIAKVRQTISAENLNMPSGTIDYGASDLQLRAVGRFQSLDDILNLVVTTGSGNSVHIRDFAEVRLAEKERSSMSLINGREGVIYSLSKNSTANIVTVSDNVLKAIGQLSKSWPELNFELLTNTSDTIKTNINNIVSTAFLSAIVAVFVLLFFLGDPKSSLIIGVSIPTSILATFAMMYFMGVTMNVVSMGGIVIGIGMLVDNSVVVLENINVHFMRGLSPKEAAAKGTKEVSMAITASTLTTLACFVPLLFVGSVVGQMLRDLSLTICFALTASLVSALTFVPMACSKLLKREEDKKQTIFTPLRRVLLSGLDKLDMGYQKLLRTCLKHKGKTIVVVLLCFALSLMSLMFVGMDFMPASEAEAIKISVSMPKGTKYSLLEEKVLEIVENIGEVPESELSYVEIGKSPSTITYNIVNKEKRQRSVDEIAKDFKQKITNIAGAEITVEASSASSSSGNGLTLSLMGDDLNELKAVSSDLIMLFSQIPGAEKIESSLEEAIPEGNIILSREKASKHGFSTSDIATAVNTAVTGVKASTYQMNGSEIDIRIKYGDEKFKYLSDLNNLTITTARGTVIPITEVAEIGVDEGAVSIRRENQQRVATISGEFDNSMDTGTIKKLVQEKLDSYTFPDDVSYSFGGSMSNMMNAVKDLITALIVAVLLIYMIMASQFESIIYPFIIMFSVPLALSGGIVGLFVTGSTITIMALMGMIMLVGIVVNNAIVLVDYTNQLIENEGLSYHEALLKAGPSRLRPILMTTLTTVIGLVPGALALSSGMETQQPLAITIIFGLTISTLLTLVFIPVLYELVEGIKKKVGYKGQIVEKLA